MSFSSIMKRYDKIYFLQSQHDVEMGKQKEKAIKEDSF